MMLRAPRALVVVLALAPWSPVARAAAGGAPTSAPAPGGWRSAPPQSSAPAASRAPATPPGMPPCVAPLAPSFGLPRAPGETIRYVVDVNEISVGTIDFRIERHGTFDGKPVTEYRSQFKIDQLVGAVLPVDGRAASLVPDGSWWPAQAMTRYSMQKNEFDDSQRFGPDGRTVTSRRVRNGSASSESRAFPGPAQDFVSAFYLVRSIADEATGCAIIYGNQRSYTVWVRPDGEEKVMTPVGLKPARRYGVVWASDRSKKAAEGRMWIGEGPDRLPLRAELFGSTHLEARIHLYETGKS